jgi:hypothetical protein
MDAFTDSYGTSPNIAKQCSLDIEVARWQTGHLIKVKEETASAKDLAVITILRQTLKEKQKP